MVRFKVDVLNPENPGKNVIAPATCPKPRWRLEQRAVYFTNLCHLIATPEIIELNTLIMLAYSWAMRSDISGTEHEVTAAK